MLNLQGVLTVLGRVLLSTIFFMAAVGNKIPHFSEVATVMDSVGVPFPHVMLAGAIVFLVAGSLSVIVGISRKLPNRVTFWFRRKACGRCNIPRPTANPVVGRAVSKNFRNLLSLQATIG